MSGFKQLIDLCFQYMDIFVSPTAAVLARFICFVAGSVLAVLICLTVWDEDVLNVEHILTIMTVLGGKNSANVLIRLQGGSFASHPPCNFCPN